MLYREIIAVCSEIHTKHMQPLCGQNVEFVSVKTSGRHSCRFYLKSWSLEKCGYVCMCVCVYVCMCVCSRLNGKTVAFKSELVCCEVAVY
jgi:hypothetical protein